MKKVVTDQQKTTVKKVLDYIRRYWFYLGLSIVLAAVTVALTLYIPILTGRAVDLIITKGQVDFAGILVILERMAVVILLTAAAQWIMNACNNKITYNVIRDIRKEAFERIEHLPLKYIDSHSYGEVVSRVIADVDQFADGLLMGSWSSHRYHCLLQVLLQKRHFPCSNCSLRRGANRPLSSKRWLETRKSCRHFHMRMRR